MCAFQLRYDTYRAAVEEYLGGLFLGGQALRQAPGGYELQPYGRWQAGEAGDNLGLLRPYGRRVAGGDSLCLCSGAGPYLFPDPRRSARHGR